MFCCPRSPPRPLQPRPRRPSRLDARAPAHLLQVLPEVAERVGAGERDGGGGVAAHVRGQPRQALLAAAAHAHQQRVAACGTGRRQGRCWAGHTGQPQQELSCAACRVPLCRYSERAPPNVCPLPSFMLLLLGFQPTDLPPTHPPGLVMMRAMRQTCLMASSNSTRSILQPAWSSQRSSSLPVLPIPQEATGHIPAQLAPDQEEGGKQAAAPAPGIGLVVLRQPLQQMGPPRQRGSSWPEHLLPPSSGSCKRPSASHLPPVKGYHAAPVPSRPARPPRSACA